MSTTVLPLRDARSLSLFDLLYLDQIDPIPSLDLYVPEIDACTHCCCCCRLKYNRFDLLLTNDVVKRRTIKKMKKKKC